MAKNRQQATLEDPTTTLQPELGDEGGGDDGDVEGEDEGGDEEGEDFYYAVTLKTGLRSFHWDEREPEQLKFDFKCSLLFPLTPQSAFTEDELEAFQQLQQTDPKRFGEKTARVFLFEIGDQIMDPREVATLGLGEELIFDPGEQVTGALAEDPAGTPAGPKNGTAPGAGGGALRDRIKRSSGGFPPSG